jgi:hypothetical protein
VRAGERAAGSDLEIAFAFIARRQASKAMSASRWSHMLSLEMGWMNPGQARAFVERAVRAGLLAPDGELMRLVIDPQAVEVPRGFRPKPDAEADPSKDPKGHGSAHASGAGGGVGVSAAPAADPFLAWVAKVAAHRGINREQVLSQVAATQAELGGLLTAEAAVLLLARRNGLDVAEAARSAGAQLQASPSR